MRRASNPEEPHEGAGLSRSVLGGIPVRSTELPLLRGKPARAEGRAGRLACEDFAAVDTSRLVLIDESGTSIVMGRTSGRDSIGVRIDAPVPQGQRLVTTLTAAVNPLRVPSRPASPCLIGASTRWPSRPRRGLTGPSIAARPHRRDGRRPPAQEAAGDRGGRDRGGLLPPFSPEMISIERIFSKLAAGRRTAHVWPVLAGAQPRGGCPTITVWTSPAGSSHEAIASLGRKSLQRSDKHDSTASPKPTTRREADH